MQYGYPVIPETITVHLGAPDENARNIEIPFIDYIKNVASSEIYPTWPENAIRANIYAQASYALNRIYTEWYRSRGYDFDITNSTQYDQAFVEGRDIFEKLIKGYTEKQWGRDLCAEAGKRGTLFYAVLQRDHFHLPGVIPMGNGYPG